MALSATAEQLDWRLEPFAPAEPQVYEVPRLVSDEFSRARAKRFIGSIATEASVEVSYAGGEQHASLKEALANACEGDVEARQLAEMNVRTDVIERTIKAGHVMSVRQEVNAQGQLMQYGQTGRTIQANSLRYASRNPHIRERTEAEARNLFRIEDAHRQQLLDDHVFVVISRAADNMSDQDMHREGFFVDTMSVALQATSANADGSLTTESAFVAGKRHRDAERHDGETVMRLGRLLGVDLSGKSAAEIIDTPLLVPKSLMQNGVIDIVRLYDEAAGSDTFFGQDKPGHDYLAYVERCRQREAELEPTVQEIVAELIAESASFRTPLDATRRLHELSEAALVRRALYDHAIDTTVFGLESAEYIQAARYYAEQGEWDRAGEFMTKAVDSADSSSCPGGGVKSSENGDSDASENTAGKDGDCEFTSKECPLCHKKNVRTVVKKLPSGKKHISGSCGCAKVA